MSKGNIRLGNIEFVNKLDTRSSKHTMVSAQGAKLFKRNPCPLHPSIEAKFESAAIDQAFPLLSDEEQERQAAELLHILMGRVMESGISFDFSRT